MYVSVMDFKYSNLSSFIHLVLLKVGSSQELEMNVLFSC